MRRHPLYAQTPLAPVRFLEQALIIPLYHHERRDGSGYPFGLSGPDIPLWARIFAVVDVWDALRSDRPYRRALPEALCLLRQIVEHSGVLYDPTVVEHFLLLIGEASGVPAEAIDRPDAVDNAGSDYNQLMAPQFPRSTLWACTVFALAVTGCGPTPTATPQPVTALGVICEPQNIDQRRTVEGYFIYPDVLDGSDPLVLILGTGPGGVEPYVHVRVPVGTGPNQVEPPLADASDLDLKVHASDGAVADLAAQVRVSGQVVAQELVDGSTCLLADPEIALTGVVNPVN